MATTKKPAGCVFCSIVAAEAAAHRVFEDDAVLAFLDRTPLFQGHVLVVPKAHVVTLPELPVDQLEPLFSRVQQLAEAVPRAMRAGGSFVAMNNLVSQSVPHLHVHVVPRKKGDGLRGFFWPRQKYAGDDEMAEVAATIRSALA